MSFLRLVTVVLLLMSVLIEFKVKAHMLQAPDRNTSSPVSGVIENELNQIIDLILNFLPENDSAASKRNKPQKTSRQENLNNSRYKLTKTNEVSLDITKYYKKINESSEGPEKSVIPLTSSNNPLEYTTYNTLDSLQKMLKDLDEMLLSTLDDNPKENNTKIERNLVKPDLNSFLDYESLFLKTVTRPTRIITWNSIADSKEAKNESYNIANILWNITNDKINILENNNNLTDKNSSLRVLNDNIRNLNESEGGLFTAVVKKRDEVFPAESLCPSKHCSIRMFRPRKLKHIYANPFNPFRKIFLRNAASTRYPDFGMRSIKKTTTYRPEDPYRFMKFSIY